MANTEVKVMFRSEISGLWYSNHNAAGSIDQVKIDDEVFKKPLNKIDANVCAHGDSNLERFMVVNYKCKQCDRWFTAQR